MSKKTTNPKTEPKVVKTTTPKVVQTTAKQPVKTAPTTSKVNKPKQPAANPEALVFNKNNYIFMGIGILLVLIGLALMSGGAMPDADTWDDDVIYNFRRTVLAPIVILAGLIVEIFAIFRK